VKSLDELAQIREEYQAQVDLRDSNNNNIKVIISMDDCGIAAGARNVLKVIMSEIEQKNLKNITVYQTECLGLCKQEPVVRVDCPGQSSVTYGNVNPENVLQIINEHLLNGNVVNDLVITDDN
jgi:NADP-reducing hydrogenase subunit HndB